MNKAEFITIAKTIEEYYGKTVITKTSGSLDLWFELLQDVDSRTCMSAVKRIFSENKFFPTISEIREACAELFGREVLSIDDAWGKVIMAIRRYGYMREAEALESLPEPCRSVVKNIGWQNLCSSENINIDRAFFRDSYKIKQERIRRDNVLPVEVKNERAALIEEYTAKAAMKLTMKIQEEP